MKKVPSTAGLIQTLGRLGESPLGYRGEVPRSNKGGHTGWAGQGEESVARGQMVCHRKAGKVEHSDPDGVGTAEIGEVLSTQLWSGSDNFLGFCINKLYVKPGYPREH